MTPNASEVAPFAVGAVLLLLTCQQPLRADAAKLIRKAFPRSHLAQVVAAATGTATTGQLRFSVLDAAVVIVPAMAMLAAFASPVRLPVTAGLGIIVLLLIMFDLRYRQLPDELTLPLAAVGLAGAEALGPGLVASVTGLIGSGGALVLLAYGFRQIRGIDGLGGGDIKLIAAMGAWLGPIGVANAIAAAALTALVTQTTGQLLREGRFEPTTRIAFGAYLAGAFWVMWCLD